MSTFPLKIVTPDGLCFDGEAEQLSVRTAAGQVGILAKHIDFIAPLGMGQATIYTEGKTRKAACIGGMLSVLNGEVTLVPTTFEWAEDIDKNRAQRAKEEAERRIQKAKDANELEMAKAKLSRALTRIKTAQ